MEASKYKLIGINKVWYFVDFCKLNLFYNIFCKPKVKKGQKKLATNIVFWVFIGLYS